MARINSDQFYINMITLNREQAALLLTLLLSAMTKTDEELQEIGRTIGFDENVCVRKLLIQMGSMVDDDWSKMVANLCQMINE